ncbi:MAG: M48 family metallopeptidase [candidate division WOR-3 bacterium]|nr:MAG: M48 family metallopeptidase [candidate division WOR-3 bacterium]
MRMDGMHPLIDRDRQEVARRYRNDILKWSILSLIVSVIFLVAILVFDISRGFAGYMADRTSARILMAGSYFCVLYLIFSVLTLPFAYFEGYSVEHKYGFSRQNRWAWFKDWAKSSLVSFVIGLVIFEVLYLIIPASPGLWWLWLSLIMIVFSIILANIFPVLILPLFYKSTPLEEGELKSEITELSGRAGVNVKGVYRIDLSSKTTKANAAVVGLGNTKRILIGDTLISNFETHEIISAVAHEIIHYRERHMWYLVLWQSFITVAMFYFFFRVQPLVYRWFGFEGAYEIAAFPVFVLIFGVISYLLRPLGASISRYYERRADGGALNLTGNAQAFISLIAKFCNEQLSIAYPNRLVEWYKYSHPSPGKRISFAEKWKRIR